MSTTERSSKPTGEITKEAVALLRRAAEITNNTEIKFAAAFIQSEYDKKHPRGGPKNPLRSSSSMVDASHGHVSDDKASSSEDRPAMSTATSPPIETIASPSGNADRKKKMQPSRSAPSLNVVSSKDNVDKKWSPRASKYNANGKRWVRKTEKRDSPTELRASAQSFVPLKKASEMQSLADRSGDIDLKQLASELQHQADVSKNAERPSADIPSEEPSSESDSKTEAPSTDPKDEVPLERPPTITATPTITNQDKEEDESMSVVGKEPLPIKLHLDRSPEDLVAPGSPMN
jgi:hypothetical protein